MRGLTDAESAAALRTSKIPFLLLEIASTWNLRAKVGKILHETRRVVVRHSNRTYTGIPSSHSRHRRVEKVSSTPTVLSIARGIFIWAISASIVGNRAAMAPLISTMHWQNLAILSFIPSGAM